MRLVLVLIEYKDKDARALHAPCLRLIKVALELFPSASVNLQFAAVVLREPPQVGAPVGAGVGVVVDMMSMLMKHQPQAVVSKSPAILVALLEPVFASNDRVLVDKLVGIFRVFYTRFPVIKDSDNAEAQTVQNKVHEKLMNGFAQGFDPNKPVTDPIVLRNLCCTLVMLEALLDTVPEYAGRFVTQLCKLLLRVARDHAQAGGQLLINPHIRQPPPRGAPRCVFCVGMCVGVCVRGVWMCVKNKGVCGCASVHRVPMHVHSREIENEMRNDEDKHLFTHHYTPNEPTPLHTPLSTHTYSQHTQPHT